ncbi:MAG: hypothetical protein HY332_24070 [Chloroflexi bacterium]|nr:hypothetical protein [Chloroflexota bacterium]
MSVIFGPSAWSIVYKSDSAGAIVNVGSQRQSLHGTHTSATLRAPIEESMHEVLRRPTTPANIHRYHEFHTAILQALVERAAPRAAEVMEHHFEAALQAIAAG